jgi:hypothetical protein
LSAFRPLWLFSALGVVSINSGDSATSKPQSPGIGLTATAIPASAFGYRIILPKCYWDACLLPNRGPIPKLRHRTTHVVWHIIMYFYCCSSLPQALICCCRDGPNISNTIHVIYR